MNEIEIDWFGVVHTLVASLSHARRIAPPSPTLNTHTYIHTHIHTHTHTRNISSYKIEIIAIIVDGSLSLERSSYHHGDLIELIVVVVVIIATTTATWYST